MRAALCKQYGPPESLVVEEVPALVAGPGQLVVGVQACGLNFPDVLMIQDKYQFKPGLPFSPGGEIAGVVKAVGEGAAGFRVGDAVIASTGWGGFAEEVAIDATRAIPAPPGIDPAVAAALLVTYGTTHHALKDRAKLRPCETLVVLGAAGGVGLSAVDLGRAMGARVIAAASSEDKLALCREYGAESTIDYSREDLKDRIKELTGGKGADVVYDPVGGTLSEAALRSTAWEGRFLVIGFASGDIPRIPLNLALLKGCDILGVFWGSFTMREAARNRANIEELLAWLVAGKIKPHVSERFPLERAGEALKVLAERRAKGKVVLVMG